MSYDKNGLHIAELSRLSLVSPFLFEIAFWMINHNMTRFAVKLAQWRI